MTGSNKEKSVSLRQNPLGPIPPDVAQAAKRAVRRRRNIYIEFADRFGELFEAGDFSEIYSRLGQSAVSPLVLLLLLIVQFNEGLSDGEVMEAVAVRLDLKYLLRLPMEHEGYDASILSEFRDRLIQGNLEEIVLNRMLEFAQANGFLKTRAQRTDSTEVVSAARRLARVELVLETMTHTLDVLTEVCPRLVIATAKKFEQLQAYQHSSFQLRISKSDEARKKLAESIGRDGLSLLKAIDQSDKESFLNEIPAVVTMKLVWQQQFDSNDDKKGPRFRKLEELSKSASLLGSPHDTEARYTTKRGKSTFGYKVHVTETCSPGGPRLITNVVTTPSTTSDSSTFEVIEKSLRAKGLTPIEHLVDAGYTKAVHMLSSREQHGTEVIGPLGIGNYWQVGQAEPSHFKIDWDGQKVTCPQGKESKTWTESRTQDYISVMFAAKDCSACPMKLECTKSASRHLEFKKRPVFEFMQKTREFQKSKEFKKSYARRAGVEGTISAYKGKAGHRSRFMGLIKTHFQNVFIAGVINVTRILDHMAQQPLSKTRVRKFAKLAIA